MLYSSLVSLLLVASTSVTAFDLKKLTTEERNALSSKLDAWKASQHGQLSRARGYHNEDMNLDDQLQRFGSSLETVDKLNAEQKHATFTVNNQFALMTSEEFAAFVRRGGLRVPNKLRRLANTTTESISTASDSIDWTTTGCVSPPKNQGACGSCWAFSAVGAIESAFCIANGYQLTLFSEQQVVSCAPNQYGCDGGWEAPAMRYLASTGICTSADYPYISGSTTHTETCNDRNCAHTQLSISNVVETSGEAAIENALRTSPISIDINSANDVFQYYQSGIITSGCSTSLDHAVVAVGYGTDGIPFFKVKNSWGQDWGERGFFRIQRGVGGTGVCGIAISPSYPVITPSSTCGPLQSDYDYPGQDLSSTPGQPGECCSKCSSTSGCVAFSWWQGTCYLKSKVGSGVRKTGVISSVLKSSGQCLQPESNTDYNAGSDILTVKAAQGDCCALCLENNDCHAYSWGWGYCSLKRGRTNVSYKEGVTSGRVYRCSGLEYGVDYVANDIGSALAPAPEDCCALCRQTNNCRAFSWNNDNGGTCYLKSGKDATTWKSGVISATIL